jgi:DNA-binding GntR family transcriptional regulator
MSIPDIEEIFELRATLEPLLIRLAVPNLRRADLVRAGHHLAMMESVTEPADWVVHNTEFHTVFYQAAGRPRILGVINVLRVLMERYFAAAMPTTGTGRADEEHVAILDAVRRGDADLAAQLTNEHLTGSYEQLIAQLLEQGFRDGIDTDQPLIDRAGII